VTGAAEVAGGLTSPASAELILGTGGLGEIGGVAGKLLPRLLSAGFSSQMLYQSYQQIPEIRKALNTGDYSTAKRLLTKVFLQGGLATLGLKHAATGKGAVTGESGATEEAPSAEVRNVEETSPVKQIIKDQAVPEVKLVEDAAAKEAAEKQATVAQPTAKAPVRVFHGTTASDVTDASKLDSEYSREGAAGKGIYLTEQPHEASAYAGPAEAATGGRVVAGLLSADAKLLDANKPLPKEIQDSLQEKFGKVEPSTQTLKVKASQQSGTATKPWDKTGEDFDSVYHGGKVQVGEVDPSKLQQRDAGFFGKGFYVAASEKAAKMYGPKVSEKSFAPDARILDVDTIHPQYEHKINPELQKEVEESQRAYLQSLPKAQKNPALVDNYMELIDPKSKAFDLHSWIDAVNRYGEQKGYDAIRFSDGEIVVKNPQAMQTAPKAADSPASYMDVMNAVRKAGGDTREVQQAVADAGYHGVKYTNQYASGQRSAMMLFGKDISGKAAGDLLTPTVPTARVVADDHIPVVSKDEVLSEAVNRIIKNGEALKGVADPEKIESREDVAKMLADSASHIKQNLDPRVGKTISFEQQKQLASDLNTTVEDLLSRRSGQAFNAEQAVAARSLLRESQTRVMNLARIAAMGDEDYQEQFAKSLAQHQEITNTIKGVAAEAGRALGSFRIKGSELPQAKLTDAFSKLPKESLTEAAKLLSKIDPNDTRQVNQFIEQIKPSSTADKVFEYYRNALLSSPKTVTVKAASEVAMMGLEAMKKFVSSGLSKDRYAAESWAYAKGAIDALQHTKSVLTGEFNLEDAPGFETGGQQAIKGKLGSVVRAPQTLLSRQTNLMYMLNYFGELNAQAARAAIKEGLSGQDLYARQEYLAHNPTEEMTDAAHETALHNTFQNELGKFGKNVQRVIQSEPLKYLFPFFKTPVNLIKATGEFSPYGLLKGIAKGDVDTTAKGLIGSSVAAGIALLASEGLVTGGGPIDIRKKQTLEATGWQPYSVKIGGKYYSYHRAEPLGLALAMVADAVHGIHSGDNWESTMSKKDNALTHISRNLDNFPFLTQIAALSTLLKGQQGTTAGNFIGRQLAGFIPALVSNVAQATDRTVRHPETITQTLQSHIPGMTQNVPPVQDITGKPVQRPVSQLGGANPFPVSTANTDPVVSELARLGVSTPALPKQIKLGQQTVTLSSDEAEQLASWENKKLYAMVSKIAANPVWKQAPDPQKQQVVKKWTAEIRKALPYQLQQMRAMQGATAGLAGQ